VAKDHSKAEVMVRDSSKAEEVAKDHSKAEEVVRDSSKAEEVVKDHSMECRRGRETASRHRKR